MLNKIAVNDSLNSSSLQAKCSHSDSLLIKLVKTTACSTLLLAALLGNVLVVAVILKDRKLRTIINFFIVNMAISDLFLPLLGMPIQIQNIFLPDNLWLVDGIFGTITCKLNNFVKDISISVSVLSLLIIAVERLFGILFLMKKQPINTKRRCLVLIAFTWLGSAVFTCSQWNIYSLHSISGKLFCLSSSDTASNFATERVRVTILVVVFVLIPFILLVALYSTIIISLRCKKQNFNFSSKETRQRSLRYRKITYMLVTIVTMFLVTWIPIIGYNVMTNFSSRNKRSNPCFYDQVEFGVIFVLYSYPAVNPFIYYTFNEKFKKGFQKLLCCCKGKSVCCKN